MRLHDLFLRQVMNSFGRNSVRSKVSAFLSYIGQVHYIEIDKTDAQSLTELVLKAIKEHSPQVQKAAVEMLSQYERVNREALGRLLEKSSGSC